MENESHWNLLSPIDHTQEEIEKEILSALPLHYQQKAETTTTEETTDEDPQT